MCFNIKVCAKRSIYAREKTKNEKKKKRSVLNVMCLVMHPSFCVCSIFLLLLPSPQFHAVVS